MMELVVDSIVAGYPGRDVLRHVSLRARAGELLALIGPNGAGKTTLLRTIGGTIRPRTGSVRLDGRDLLRLSPRERARLVATAPQGATFPAGFNVAETVLLGRHPHLPLFGGERRRDFEAARTAMVRTGVWFLAGRRVESLSGGEQQRVLIARALAQEPRVLLLDEATAHLDLRYQAQVLRLVRALARDGLVTIATLHDLNLAALYADRLALLDDGEITAYGTPADVLQPELLSRVYGVHLSVTRHPSRHTPLVTLADDEAQAPDPATCGA